MKQIEDEVVGVLKNAHTIGFEDIQDEQLSPLNKAVIEKDIAGVSQKQDWNIWKPEKRASQNSESTMEKEYRHVQQGVPLDAPEQEFGEDIQEDPIMDDHSANGQPPPDEQEFELPTDTAKKAADTILGITNNVLAAGGGYFVKIRKHQEFYEFDEIPELIDAQNKKNIDRIKLNKEDKALLKPPLVEVLKKKAKRLTPEQQLMGAALSIALKKGMDIMEIKAENEQLVDRILDIIREEKGDVDSGFESGEEERMVDSSYQEMNETPEAGKKKQKEQEQGEDSVIIEEYDEEPRMENAIIEVAADSPTG